MPTDLPLAVAAAVLGSAVLHATWNALAKAIPDRLLASALIGISFTTIGGVWCVFAPLPSTVSWPFLVTGAVLQTGYLLVLMAAYSQGEFRLIYPVARGTAPLLVTIFSLAILGERLHAVQLVGIALVVAALGLLVAMPSRGNRAAGHRPHIGLLLALVTGVVIAAYSLVDGIGVRHSGSAAGYAAWSMLVHGPILLATCIALAGPRRLVGWLRRRPVGSSVGGSVGGTIANTASTAVGHEPATALSRRSHGYTPVSRRSVMIAAGLIGGALSVAAYAIVLWAQSRASLSMVSALRETSVLFAGVIGALIFREGFSIRQTFAAILVVGGIVLMQLV